MVCVGFFFFFKQKTAYEMRISDWSSDVCSSDLMTAQAWPALAASLPLTGLAAELARQSEWLGLQGKQVTLRVAIRTLAESPGKSRLCTVLSEYFRSEERRVGKGWVSACKFWGSPYT